MGQYTLSLSFVKVVRVDDTGLETLTECARLGPQKTVARSGDMLRFVSSRSHDQSWLVTCSLREGDCTDFIQHQVMAPSPLLFNIQRCCQHYIDELCITPVVNLHGTICTRSESRI